MTIGTTVIQRALQHIGAHSPLQPAPPESLDVALEVINSMLAEWEDDDIVLGTVPLSVIGDELSEPLGARNGIQYNLALALAPYFPGAQVSTELTKQAKLGYNKIKRRWKNITIPRPVVRETLPTGQGNKDFGYFDYTYFPKDSELG